MVKEDVRLRLHAVKQHLEKGVRTAEICQLFGISERTLRNWCRNYREEGVEGLRDEPRRPHTAARTGSTGTSSIGSFNCDESTPLGSATDPRHPSTTRGPGELGHRPPRAEASRVHGPARQETNAVQALPAPSRGLSLASGCLRVSYRGRQREGVRPHRPGRSLSVPRDGPRLSSGEGPGGHEQPVVGVQGRPPAQGPLRRQRELLHLEGVPRVLRGARDLGDLREAVQPPRTREARTIPRHPDAGAGGEGPIPFPQSLPSRALPLAGEVQPYSAPRRDWLGGPTRGLPRPQVDEQEAVQEPGRTARSPDNSTGNMS